MQLHYRDTEKREEIVNFIRRSQDGVTLLWQPIYGKQKLKQEVSDMMLSESRGVVRFYFSTLDTQLDFNYTVYIKLPYLDSIFKGHIKKKTYEYIEITIPERLKAPELRKHPRSLFLPSDNKSLHVSQISEFMTMAMQTTKVMCLDISTHGMSFIISDRNKRNFKPSSEIFLERLGSFRLPERIAATIVYAVPFTIEINEKKVKTTKLGAALARPLKGEELHDFLNS